MSLLANRKVVIAAVVPFAAIMVVTIIILNDIPTRDVAHRYTHMAEAFAQGDWMYAFHPRIQPLQTVSGGIIAWIFQCNSFMALKIASALWFIAGIFIVWKLFREIYEDKPWIATAATAFYALYPHNIVMASEGLRESSKTFILLLIAWALVKIYKNVKAYSGYILLGIGCSMALICRADMVMTGLFLLFTGTVLECREKKFPRISLIPIVLTGITAVLSSFLNYYLCKHAMPDYRFAEIFVKIAKRPAGCADAIMLTAGIMMMLTASAIVMAYLLRKIHVGIFLAAAFIFTLLTSIRAGLADKHNTVGEFVNSILEGSFHVVGLLCLLVIIFLIWRKKFTGCEFILCLIVLANAFFNIVPMQLFHKALYVSSRYLYVAVPLMAGFFAIGVNIIYQFVRKQIGDKWARVALIVYCAGICGGFIFAAVQPQLRAYTRKKDIAVRKGTYALTSAIQNDYHGEKYRASQHDLQQYYSKKAPFVLFIPDDKSTVAAYMAGGSCVVNAQDDPDYFVGNKLPEQFCPKAQKVTEISFGKHSKTLWRINR